MSVASSEDWGDGFKWEDGLSLKRILRALPGFPLSWSPHHLVRFLALNTYPRVQARHPPKTIRGCASTRRSQPLLSLISVLPFSEALLILIPCEAPPRFLFFEVQRPNSSLSSQAAHIRRIPPGTPHH